MKKTDFPQVVHQNDSKTAIKIKAFIFDSRTDVLVKMPAFF